jgi:hypothetical protein
MKPVAVGSARRAERAAAGRVRLFYEGRSAMDTRLTRRFGLTHPIFSAPMNIAAGGRLAAAVTNAGGLGLIGGAYGDWSRIEAELEEAGETAVGCGFITGPSNLPHKRCSGCWSDSLPP